MTFTTAGAASAPSPRISACLPWPGGTTSRSFSSRASGRSGVLRVDRLLAGAQLGRHRRVARQVDALEHATPRRAAARGTRRGRRPPPARSAPAVLHRQALQPGHHRPARARGPRGCRPGSCRSPRTHCRRRSGRSPRPRPARPRSPPRSPPRWPAGSHSSPSVASRRPRSAPIASVSRICSSASGGPSASTVDLAAVLLHQPHRLLHAALLVRADREAEVARLDRLLVVGEDHPPAGERHALDADEDPHAGTAPAAFTRSLSGSKSGVEPATATVTG